MGLRGRFREPLAALLIAACAAATGCSANPATGQRQLNFYSEAQEIAMGREADASIAAELGLVDDPALQEWVAGIGLELARRSERPGLPWSFKVVDDPAVNAFALPGGFIYVTRGLLTHLHSEAQLAGVLGHEIGHVTAQHSVNQMSKQQLAMGGLVLGSAVSPEVSRLGGLAQTGLGLLFLKYGRADESQADELGLRYMTRGGYEPREMPGVFEVLRRVGEIAGGSAIPSWLSSHPDPGSRSERTERRIAEGSYAPGEVGSERFLRRTDGLVFGADPRQGFFEGSTFFHPDLAFRLDVPSGWTAANEKSRVIAVHPDRVAQVELRLAAGDSPAEAARRFTSQEGASFGETRDRSVNGLSAVETPFSVDPGEGRESIAGVARFVGLGGRVFQLTAVALESRVGESRGTIDGCLDSFARLRERARLEVEPQRIRLEKLARASTFDAFLRDRPSEAPLEVLELINGIDDAGRRLEAGTLLKRIEGRAIGSQRVGPDAR